MIIDCHGHYTTAPKAHETWRTAQLEADKSGKSFPARPTISDDEIREGIEKAQLRLQTERGTDLALISPRAAGMGHHVGSAAANEAWAAACNEMVHRACLLYPTKFIGVAQLPQTSGVGAANCVAELERAVKEYGFVGCNINPDPSGGMWRDPPLTDPSWHPLFEKMVELDVPGMIHVSLSCNPAVETAGGHYINADTTAFMQLLIGDLFKTFPTLKIIIPHGGGAVPYQWARYRALANLYKKPQPSEHLLNNVFFDTCIYNQTATDLLAKVIPVDNILFASEMVGAVQGIDPETGHDFDDTKRYIDGVQWLSDADRRKIFEGNARRVYGRLSAQIDKQFKGSRA